MRFLFRAEDGSEFGILEYEKERTILGKFLMTISGYAAFLMI